MIKTKLMHKFKTKFGGEYIKQDGRWFWTDGKENHLVTTGWLINELNKPVDKPKTTKKETKKPEAISSPVSNQQTVTEVVITKPKIQYKPTPKKEEAPVIEKTSTVVETKEEQQNEETTQG